MTLALYILGATLILWLTVNEVRHRRNMRAREARIGFYKVSEEESV